MFDYYVVAFDTDRIKSYVFVTNKLKEIRGASAILDKLNEEGTLELLHELSSKGNYKITNGEFKKIPKKSIENSDWEVIFLAGGSGQVLFKKKELAQKFARQLEEMYEEKTDGGASITATVVDINDSSPDWYSTARQKLEKALRQKKDAKYFHAQSLSHPYFKYCDSNGNRYAEVGKIKAANQDQWFLSKEVRIKRNNASGARQLFKRFLEHVKRKSNDYKAWGEHLDKIEQLHMDFEKFIEARYPFPSEIDDLEDSRGYIGLIYADGNRMGERIQKIKTKNAYHYFSKQISECNREAIFHAIAKNIAPQIHVTKNFIESIPFEIFLLGGDDLIMAVPGEKALQITVDYLDQFKQLTESKFKKYSDGDNFKNILFQNGVSISAGLIFAKGNYPLHLLVDYAGELLKKAKQKGSRKFLESKNDDNYIDFIIIKDSSITSIADKKEELTMRDYSGDDLELSSRPYSTNKLKEIISEIQEWKDNGFPRNKLGGIYQALRSGKLNATLKMLQIYTRLPNDVQKLFIEKYIKNNRMPWESIDSREITTRFNDLVELYEFVPQKKRTNADKTTEETENALSG